MSSDPGTDLVRSYLERLHAAGWSLPPDRRDELVTEVREHIAAALTVERGRGIGDELASRTVLDRLGPPEDIVRAEVEGSTAARAPSGGYPLPPVGPPYVAAAYPGGYYAAPRPSPWGGLEIGAVVALVLGGTVVPVLGTIVGLVLAWASPQWTHRQKAIATLLAVLPLLFLVFVIPFR